MTVGGAGIGGNSSGSVGLLPDFQHPVLLDLSWVGSLLDTNLIKAKEMASIQQKAADDFTTTFPQDTIFEWKRMVQEWEADPSRPNPYVSNVRGMPFFTSPRSQ